MSTIKVILESDDRLNDLVEDLATFYKRMNRKIAREVVPEVERFGDNLVKRTIGKEAPPRNRAIPFVWSTNPKKNARARRWFFANYPNGYTRTGQLRRNWLLDIQFNAKNGQAVISLSNDANAASYVYGSEEFNFRQVPGHARTGWPNAGDEGADTVIQITEKYNRDIEALVDELIRKL